MNQLALKNSFSMPMGQEMDQIVSVCKVLATCPYYQKLGPGGVLAIYLTAREMSLPLMMCLNGGMYTFSGVVSLSAQLMNMLIVNAGHRADVLHLDEKGCKIRFWRCDRPKDNCTFEYEYTIEMAAKAGYLGKDNWKKSPKDMNFSRCLSGGARKFMPDVIMNAYAIGELGRRMEIFLKLCLICPLARLKLPKHLRKHQRNLKKQSNRKRQKGTKSLVKNTSARTKRWLTSVKSLRLPIRQKLKLSIQPSPTRQDS